MCNKTFCKDSLEAAMNAALESARQSAASIFVDPKNFRPYECSVDKCSRSAYAGGLCNAHYIRLRSGKDVHAPVRARKRDGICESCGEVTGTKGGWGLCPKHYTKARTEAIKGALIEAMGGACQRCEGVFHRSVYDFHHKEEKDLNPSYIIKNKAVAAIAEEVSKCVLLCANCHRMEHYCEF